VTPRPFCKLPTSLVELECYRLNGAVVEFHDELTTGFAPRSVRLPPVVDVLPRHSVILETTCAGCGHFTGIDGVLLAGARGDLLGDRIALREDIQAKVATKAELHGHDGPGLDLVDHRRGDGRRETAAGTVAEIVDHVDSEAGLSGITRIIGGRAGNDCLAYREGVTRLKPGGRSTAYRHWVVPIGGGYGGGEINASTGGASSVYGQIGVGEDE
jgi:hypothetical protein